MSVVNKLGSIQRSLYVELGVRGSQVNAIEMVVAMIQDIPHYRRMIGSALQTICLDDEDVISITYSCE